MKVTGSDGGPQKPARRKPGRVAVSCAECRRLKMKCDRGNPCENCTKRGCATICPDGTLTTGRHNKMILSNTEELHDKIEALLDRIRLLEDALRNLQASVSTHPHPLLAAPTTESLLSTIHAPPVRQYHVQSRRSVVDEPEDVVDSFGTLSVGSDGETSYLGESARSDYLLCDSDTDDELEIGRLPKPFYDFCWPECPPPDNSIEEDVLGYLPDLREAYNLCEIYLNLSSWLGVLIPREMVRDDFIAHVYHLPNYPWADSIPTCPHRLALLFTIFSIGALFDPEREPNNVQSDDYYHLARVALSFKSSVLETTVYAVLAIVHMSYIMILRDSPQGREQSWVMLGVANKLASSMGLHRDSAHWKLDEKLCERRHTAFWQLYLMESLASLHFGRPASLSDSFVECPMPKHINLQESTSIESRSKYLSWLVSFSRLARRIFSEAFGAKKLSYSVLLELDSKLRNFGEPDWEPQGHSGNEGGVSNEDKIQRWCVLYCKETILLHIHRGFLMEATNDNPQNPSIGKYGQSIQACFESSYRLIEGMAWVTENFPQISSRIIGWYGACLSSALTADKQAVLCILVARSPNSGLARPAMEKLDCLYSVLQKVSNANPSAKKNLQETRRLRNLARAAYDKSRLVAHNSIPREISVVLGEDINALARSCGKTHTRTRRGRNFGSDERRRRREARLDVQVIQQPEQSWNDRTRKLAVASSSSGVIGPVNCSDDLIRFGLSGDSMATSFGPALDPSWSHFMQQLGF